MFAFIKRLFSKGNKTFQRRNAGAVPLTKRTMLLDQSIASKKQEADACAKEFRRCFDEVRNRETELRKITAEADREAAAMRQCFQRSQQAYASGDGATAKALSLEGHAHQRRVEELNSNAQAIRAIGKRGKEREEKCKKLNTEVAKLARGALKVRSLTQIISSIEMCQGGILDMRLGHLPDRTLHFLYKMAGSREEGIKSFFVGISNPALDNQMAQDLPEALQEILSCYGPLPGLFSPIRTRGPGATSWVVNLKNRNSASAAGTAYEILATRRLMNTPANGFSLNTTDTLSLGPKQQARYLPDKMKTEELLAALVKTAPKRWMALQGNERRTKRRTVEADLQIYRNGREIFVDFKHSFSRKRGFDPSELLGVAVALATGEINEAHYISNAAFDGAARDRVKDINSVLSKWGAGRIEVHGGYSW